MPHDGVSPNAAQWRCHPSLPESAGPMLWEGGIIEASEGTVWRQYPVLSKEYGQTATEPYCVGTWEPL